MEDGNQSVHLTKQQEFAHEYIEKHNINNVLGDILNEIVFLKPAQPLIKMVEALLFDSSPSSKELGSLQKFINKRRKKNDFSDNKKATSSSSNENDTSTRGRMASNQQAAEEYLDKHNLKPFLAELLQQLVLESN